MKKYSLEAHIGDDEGNITGMLLKRGGGTDAPLIHRTVEQFIHEVSLGNVQLFEHSSSSELLIKPDMEEMIKYKKLLSIKNLSTNMIFNSGFRFNERWLKYIQQDPRIQGISIAATKVVKGVPMVTFGMLSRNGISTGEQWILKDDFKIKPIQLAENLYVVVTTREQFIECLKWLTFNSLTIGISSHTHNNVDNNILYKRGYMPGWCVRREVEKTYVMLKKALTRM